MKKDELTENDIRNIHILIGKNVKKMRVKKKMTQLQLSCSIGHSAVGTISMCEIHLNDKHFNIEHLFRIANALDCNVIDFLKDI